jgi:hypothetical protein
VTTAAIIFVVVAGVNTAVVVGLATKEWLVQLLFL